MPLQHTVTITRERKHTSLSGTRADLLLSGGRMPLNSADLAQLTAFKLELERLEIVTENKEDIEYKMVTRWLRNRMLYIEREGS